MPAPLRESRKIVKKRTEKDLVLLEPYKILIQEPPKSLPQDQKSFHIQAPLAHGICKIFMQGPLREDLTRLKVEDVKA